MTSFVRATKTQQKARLALIGPSGSGKTMSALKIATGLGERIAVVDTENGSSALYSDEFVFDILPLHTFSPETYIDAIHAAETAGYDVLIIDSLSHAWVGKEGVLEQVDHASARMRGNSFGSWREVTPRHNALVNALVRCKCHLIVTMRSKTEYVQEKDEHGKTVVRKVGLAPVQRDGLEYEFDIVGDMDAGNRLIVSKSRMRDLSGMVFDKPTAELGTQILAWLQSGRRVSTDPETIPGQPATAMGPEQVPGPPAPPTSDSAGARADATASAHAALSSSPLDETVSPAPAEVSPFGTVAEPDGSPQATAKQQTYIVYLWRDRNQPLMALSPWLAFAAGVKTTDQLTTKQASRIIEHLKKIDQDMLTDVVAGLVTPVGTGGADRGG